MQSEALQAEYARRPYKALDRETGEVVGFNTLVDMRDALAGGHCVRIDDTSAGDDPSRNYRKLTTDQVRVLCQTRNILGFLTMSHEQQIAALMDRDKQDDARNNEALAKGKAPTPKPPAKGGKGKPAEAPATGN
jgi:hypothetical protein